MLYHLPANIVYGVKDQGVNSLLESIMVFVEGNTNLNFSRHIRLEMSEIHYVPFLVGMAARQRLE